MSLDLSAVLFTGSKPGEMKKVCLLSLALGVILMAFPNTGRM